MHQCEHCGNIIEHEDDIPYPPQVSSMRDAEVGLLDDFKMIREYIEEIDPHHRRPMVMVRGAVLPVDSALQEKRDRLLHALTRIANSCAR
jgi:hypothetical protein